MYTPESLNPADAAKEEQRRADEIANRKYGKAWNDLTIGEQRSIYKDFDALDDAGYDIQRGGQLAQQQAMRGQTVGPSNVYVRNPWDSLAAGVQTGVGIGMRRKASKQREEARDVAGSLGSRSAAEARMAEEERAKREEERREALMIRMFGK